MQELFFMNKILLLLTFIAINTTIFTQPISAQEAYRRGIIGGLAQTQARTGERSRANSTSSTSPRATSLRTRYGIRANEAKTNRKVKSTF